MGKDTGFVRFSCDRPWDAHDDKQAHDEYIKEDAASNKWYEVKYKDAYGVERTYYLCDECYKKYQELTKEIDQMFNDFITGIKEA